MTTQNKYLDFIKSASDDEHSTLHRGARALGRGAVSGAAGSLLGQALGEFAGKAVSPQARVVAGLAGRYVGGVAGAVHGVGKSIRNQTRESGQVAFDPYMQKYAGADRLFAESRVKPAISKIQARSQVSTAQLHENIKKLKLDEAMQRGFAEKQSLIARGTPSSRTLKTIGVAGLAGAVAYQALKHLPRSKAHQERNRYLQKSASMTVSPDKSEPVKDLVNTGVIGLAGGVTNTLADRLLHGSKGASGGKAFAIGTGLGLVGDYGALRLNKYINHKIDDHVVAPT
jgi:hypothetical protein